MPRNSHDEAEALWMRTGARAEPVDELPLFAAPIEARTLVRASDPEPSHVAAAKVASGSVQAQERRILSALFHYGPMTAQQLDGFQRWHERETSRRTGRMKEEGLIEVVGEGRTEKGNACALYGVTEKGAHQVRVMLCEGEAA